MTELDLEPIEARDSEWPHKANIEEMALDRRALLREVKRLRSLLGEEEWEYGVHHVRSDGSSSIRVHLSREDAESDFATCGMFCDLTRRPAGPWQPVPPWQVVTHE